MSHELFQAVVQDGSLPWKREGRQRPRGAEYPTSAEPLLARFTLLEALVRAYRADPAGREAELAEAAAALARLRKDFSDETRARHDLDLREGTAL